MPDRRRMTLTEMVPLVAMFLQLAALVWGASALKSSVDELRGTTVGLSATMKEIQTTTTSLSIDVGVLKAQALSKK